MGNHRWNRPASEPTVDNTAAEFPEVDDAALQHEALSMAMEQTRRQWERAKQGGMRREAEWALGQWLRLNRLRLGSPAQ